MPQGYRNDGTKLGFQPGHRPYRGMLGKKTSNETKKKISAALTGRVVSEETKRKMSISHYDVRGEKNPMWKGGISHDRGYIERYVPDHPSCVSNRYVREHRLVMEKKIGRILKKTEVVHHINGNKKDNRPENLMLLKNESEHRKLHHLLAKESFKQITE